ncbi:TraR/DksA family transcriptional regulator [Roseateles flavus]|uniref:TraR/DksA family transcriptional regulator n=1 Tax=Roseateles flavus TaxID=3149041 RepID=A0ABV0GBM5_9BURK
MSTSLTPGQKGLLETALLTQRSRLEAELKLQLGGEDRVTHAREQLLQDTDGETAHEADREVDLARSDATLLALRQVDAALQRLQEPDFGHCADCGAAIAFERLRLSPQVTRCIECQSAAETRGGGAHHATL